MDGAMRSVTLAQNFRFQQVPKKENDGGSRMRRLLETLVVLVLVGVSGYAQTFRGAINGTVSDPSGAVVSAADVKATEIATGVVHSTITTSGGEFAFQDLPLGAYRVTVTVKGFQQTNVENVTVAAGSVY